MDGSLTRLEKAGILVAIGAAFLSLAIAAWSAFTTNAYSELTSRAHVKVYPLELEVIDQRPESDSRRGITSPHIVCSSDFRLVNIGGAGSVLESIDVTVQIGDNLMEVEVQAITEYTTVESWKDGISSWAYAEEHAFPVVIEPYGVFDLPTVLVELQASDGLTEFYVGMGYDIVGKQYVPPNPDFARVTVSYDFRFADAAQTSIPPRACSFLHQP